jgi:predicted nucleic acid binding AN1-type Zn finger protein
MTTLCDFCNEPDEHGNLLFKCPYCGKFFCSKHRLPPNHSCISIKEWAAKNPYQVKKTQIKKSPYLDEEKRTPYDEETTSITDKILKFFGQKKN